MVKTASAGAKMVPARRCPVVQVHDSQPPYGPVKSAVSQPQLFACAPAVLHSTVGLGRGTGDRFVLSGRSKTPRADGASLIYRRL